jgi:hypothetical protein
MPIENILMRKVAREIQEWIYLGIEDGMHRSAQDYIQLTAQGRTAEADAQLSRAVDMPFRALARIEAMEVQYTTEYIEKCLALYGDCTLAELKSAIISKQDTAKDYVSGIIDSKIDNSTVASAITTAIKPNSEKWVAPIPAAYKDIVTVESAKLSAVKTETVTKG